MFLSVFDMFKVGIGPSSSHMMGPVVAAARFLDHLRGLPFAASGLRAGLRGSLAFTGTCHATDLLFDYARPCQRLQLMATDAQGDIIARETLFNRWRFVVTAPTNGAAGAVPATIRYWLDSATCWTMCQARPSRSKPPPKSR